MDTLDLGISGPVVDVLGGHSVAGAPDPVPQVPCRLGSVSARSLLWVAVSLPGQGSRSAAWLWWWAYLGTGRRRVSSLRSVPGRYGSGCDLRWSSVSCRPPGHLCLTVPSVGVCQRFSLCSGCPGPGLVLVG